MNMKLAIAAALFLLTNPASAETSSSGTFAEAEAGRIYYETCGAGSKTIVLLHDGVMHSAAFDDVWPILCERFRVIRYDRRGYGRSPAATAPYAPVEDLAAVMRAARVERASLVGSSSGGGLAVEFALAHPEAVERLVLVGASLSGFRPSEHFINRNSEVMQRVQRGDLAGAVAADRYILAPGSEAARRRLVEIVAANPQNLAHADPSRRAAPAKDRLATVRNPTLILVGEYDIPDVHAQAGAAEAMIAGARRIVMTDSGHFMYLEHPREFSDAVMRFVAGQ
jgi:pimeloyl-ACP methyl ester carboxylesterase